MKSPVSTFAVIAAGLLSIFIQQVTEAQDPASAAEPGVPVPAPPSIRPGPSELERPGLGQPSADFSQTQSVTSPDRATNDATSSDGMANPGAANLDLRDRTTPRSQTPSSSPSLRRIRLARAPNMFGDFFNAPPTLSFIVPQIGYESPSNSGPEEILSPVSGSVQNALFGGGPRLKISDNFSPIPRSRIFAQSHYFHNLTTTRLPDDPPNTTGGINQRNSVFVTTLGAEFLSDDEQSSIEFRLPLIHAASTNSALIDSYYGPVTSQNSSNGNVGNLSVILKHVLAEDRGYLVSGGFGVNIPTANDVTGNLAHVDYSVQNETVNLIPFVAMLFAPRDNVFVQLHSQIDIPIGNDDFRYSEQPSSFYTPQSGTFGSYRESILASVDFQAGYRLFSNPMSRCVRSVTAIAEVRYTTALNNSTVATGSAGAFDYYSDTDVTATLSQTSPRMDYLNMTFGVQLNIRNDW